jgi:hypothetical protein
MFYTCHHHFHHMTPVLEQRSGIFLGRSATYVCSLFRDRKHYASLFIISEVSETFRQMLKTSYMLSMV